MTYAEIEDLRKSLPTGPIVPEVPSGQWLEWIYCQSSVYADPKTGEASTSEPSFMTRFVTDVLAENGQRWTVGINFPLEDAATFQANGSLKELTDLQFEVAVASLLEKLNIRKKS